MNHYGTRPASAEMMSRRDYTLAEFLRMKLAMEALNTMKRLLVHLLFLGIAIIAVLSSADAGTLITASPSQVGERTTIRPIS